MTLPNFLLIGDIKAGSTSLYYYLSQHPDVFMPSGLKELRYFSYDKDNPYHVAAKSSRVRTLDEYEQWFKEGRTRKAIGEASPNYLRSPIAARNIHSSIPNARLIACLRNPADRLYSLFLMSRRYRADIETFEQRAFKENATWIKGNYYWQDLKRFYDLFPRDHLKIILFDDLVSATEATTRDTYHFLEVDDSFVPDYAIQNEGGLPRYRAIYTNLVRVKNAAKRLWRPPTFARAAWAKVRRRSLYKPPLSEQTRQKILEVCFEDILRTQELIGRDLTHWLT